MLRSHHPVEATRFTTGRPPESTTSMTGTPTEAAELPGGPLVVSTVGMAVPDIWDAMTTFWKTLGWGSWSVYRQEPPALKGMRYRGESAEFSFLVAGTSTPGNTPFWLCQPLEGPSLYRDLVEEGIPGPHFMTVWRETEVESAAVVQWFLERGASELMSARVEGSIEFTFLDTRSLCGLILETGSGRSADQRLEATYP
jgi:methylmalonyl-CoA/ethylmalonyl-CoA epimerase